MEYEGEDLFQEKSLWEIYRVCVTRLKISRFNASVCALVTLLLSVYAYSTNNSRGQIEASIRSLADMGLGYGTTILGFLIAGFTIFATLTKPTLLRQMYHTTHPSGLNYVKVNFFAFIEVFIIYLTFIMLCLAIKLFAPVNGPLTEVIQWFNSFSFSYVIRVDILKKIGFVIFGASSFYAMLALKSFVYNTHHAVMTLIVWGLNE
jgi:hypothetical protein